MPHLSKGHISENIKQKLDDYILAFLVETSERARERIFMELLTKTERLMLAKRLMLLLLISQKAPTHSIGEALKMSPSTVARFETRVEQGAYSNTEKWLGKERIRNRLVRIVSQLLASPFKARYKSLTQLLDE